MVVFLSWSDARLSIPLLALTEQSWISTTPLSSLYLFLLSNAPLKCECSNRDLLSTCFNNRKVSYEDQSVAFKIIYQDWIFFWPQHQASKSIFVFKYVLNLISLQNFNYCLVNLPRAHAYYLAFSYPSLIPHYHGHQNDICVMIRLNDGTEKYYLKSCIHNQTITIRPHYMQITWINLRHPHPASC